MKTKIPAAMLGRTLQVAAFLNLPTDEAQSAGNGKASLAAAPEITDETRIDVPLFIDIDQPVETNAPTTFPAQMEWDASAARRFKQLAEREALGTASSEEIRELDHLSGMRRRSEAPRSGADVLREYEQGQLIRNLLQSLKRYVEFEQRTGPAKTGTSGRGTKTAASAT